jgi:monoamine oxidase
VAAFVAKKKLAGADLTAFKYALNVNYEHEYGAAISDLSLWFDGDKALPGEDRLVLGGYQQLVKFLARGVDVRLNTKVTQIDYSAASGGVVVRTAAGTFAAKRVIVTLPLGVLKANSVSFKPALPASNAKAIAALGMGLLNKCVLVFDKPFWGSKLEFVERIAAAGNGAWGE